MQEGAHEDAALVERVRRGDVDAYAVLVERYRDLALRAAYFVVGEIAEAEDAAQEGFTKAYFALDRLPAGIPFRPWLLRIVINEARNLRTAAQRRAGRVARAAQDLSLGSSEPSAETTALAQRRRELVLAALLRLREEDRLVITYRYLFDLPEAETAQALGWARGTVKSRLSRALDRLRRQLRDVAPALVVPDIGVLMGQTLGEAGVLAPSRGAQPFADAVIQRITAGGLPPGRRLSERLQSLQGPFGLAAAALLLLTAGALALLQQVRPPAPPPGGSHLVVYGEELTQAERQELAGVLETNGAAAVETVTREELVAAWQAAGLPIDQSYRATSSAALTCLGAGEGLRVRTRHITRIPAAAYANVLLVAGVRDVSVLVAGPPTRPITGETAVVGVLKAAPRCQGRQQLDPGRVALAHELLGVTAGLAEELGSWDTASAVMLKAVEGVVTGEAQGNAAISSALDSTIGKDAVAPTLQSKLAGFLKKLGEQDHGTYARGYRVRQIAPDEVEVLLTGTEQADKAASLAGLTSSASEQHGLAAVDA